jgi:hypothetical protein
MISLHTGAPGAAPARPRPAQGRGEGDHGGEREQRVLQKMRQSDVTLVFRALKLKVRGALR